MKQVQSLFKLLQSLRHTRYFPLLIIGVLIGLPALVCLVTLTIYLILPFPHRDILILGVDSRDGEGWVTRADSIILVGVDPSSLSMTMMSVPRDLSIDVPGYGLQRINTVNMLGEMEGPGRGPELLKMGVEQSFGVVPERYVRLDFNGFVQLINAVGGITIDVPQPLTDHNYPTDDYGVITVSFDAGLQQMDGERALIYARTRYADDDYRRAERQQQVVSALMGKLINPVYWPAATVVLQGSIDTDLTLWDMLTLAPPVLIGGPRGERLVINRDYITVTAEGVTIPDYEKISPWLDTYFD